MAEILKEWLTERLQRPIKWEAEEFGDMMKNGNIIANILLSYNIINDEKYYLIRSGYALEDLKNNWKYLTAWLKDLRVHLNEIDLSNIMEGRGSTLLRLFYQLFLHLDKKDRIDFIKSEIKMVSNLIEKMGNRFKVNRVEEDKEYFVDDLSKPLLDEKQFIEWQRKKTEQVKELYDFMRHKYSKILNKIEESKTPLQRLPQKTQNITNKEKIEMEKFALKYPCKFENYTYEQLLALDEKAVERKKSLIDSEWAKNYMDNLYTRMYKRSDSEEFQKQICNVISGSLWDFSVAEEETKFDIELAKKVMKLSQFEKQMCTQIMETKQQARNLVQNRIRAEREFADQREQQFNQYLDNVKEQIHLEVVEIDFEKQRQNMLHKKLYAEKIKRKRQRYYEICYETLLSIIDYGIKYAYFKKLIGGDIPDRFIHEWKTLYYKQQPIFDILDPMENILKEQGIEEESSIQEEEVIRLELNRQDALNENEFKEYHNYSYPWALDLLIPNYDPEAEERKYEYLGTKILGHVVYTLLDIKYPYPPPRPPANLPHFSVKALLCGLPDRSITIAMQTLLNLRRIHIVRVESAINFCLKKFKTEMIGCTDIELSFDKFILAAQEEENKELLQMMKVDDEVINKTGDVNINIVSGTLPLNTKQTQTPKTIPEKEIVLSAAADLGKYTYEILNFGESLTDHLLAAMIVEYIKDQGNITGFVLVNYPKTYRQAQILEETFSGRAPPDVGELNDRDDIYLEESIIKHRTKEIDPYKAVRVSKLVSDPHKRKNDIPFDSYFTCYIKLKETEDILQEFVIWNLTEENSELIDRFYAALGINYSMYYEVIEKVLLAQICKYIIGDYTMPLKSCDEIFGENVLSSLDFPSSDDKRTKSKIVKPEVSNRKSKEKIRQVSKISKISLNNELEVVKAPNSNEERPETINVFLENVSDDNQSRSMTSVKEIKILAGEEDWNYGDLPIPEIIGIALATCWEEIEKTYICDMQQLFLAKRLQMNCLIPYTRFIKDKMEQILTLPSLKQDLVSCFQKDYNEFEYDWREINLAKNEWHCRVKELQNKLYHICDEGKLHAQQQRYALICENWAMEELTSMANTYISCMQTELNRSILTFQALHDFYFAMIKRMPPNDRLSSKDLTKILKESEETSGSRKGGEDKVYRQLKAAFQELQLKNIKIDYSNNPFNLIIENNVKFALKVIKDTNDSYRSLISREYSEIAKITPPVKRKDDNNTSEETIKFEEIFIQKALKCMEEWTMAINGEMFRASLRMFALQYKCYQDMKLFNDNIYNTFTEVQNDINTHYMNEIKAVDRLCKYLQMAVEGGRKITETLILEHDGFIIDPNLLQFSTSELSTDKGETVEVVKDLDFKVGQLARLRTQFKIVAPTGIILQQAFIYLLQDFFFFGKESCEGPLFPEAWNRLDPEQVPKLVYLLFGDTCYIDWRDFLIYCLNIRFPTLEELLEMRKNFRCTDIDSTELISRNNFLLEELWFEEDFDLDNKYSQLRKNLTKHFLFELFETSQDKMNYSAFLLAFCKSVNPIEGFTSALSMAVGKKICFNFDECQEVVCNLIKLKQYEDKCLACVRKCACEYLDKLITDVVNTCEGITIIELEYTEPFPITDEKSKKEKSITSKVKKIESSQSARLPKMQKSTISSKSKIAQSAIDVKTTFICKPSEEETDTVNDKLPEKEEVEEEHKSEVMQENPDIIYAVSQKVIWNVLQICLPWHFVLLPEEKTTPYVQQVKDIMKRLEGDTDNGEIYVCKFVTDSNVCKLLHKMKKFTAINLAVEVRKVFI
ncbi:sperm flagellar protein 2-like [Galleria mellonella]|uniref:Sperm flagellar protein 2-like n=1 Tax=Galleria mellonella TaxID=7137 RepID=A0A6J1WN78_GALME|nr:sperm flagellar protein 2-like [Galleria mellonella]